jgi:tyrosine-protein kinase Etk/Wzc
LFTLLVQQLEQARIEEAQDETAFQVLDTAVPPDKKVKPRRSLNVLLATVVGAFLGVLGAFFREYMDPVIHTREHIERRLGMPLLATIPPLGVSHRQPQSVSPSEASLLLHQPHDSPSVEAYRYLYTRLKHHNNGHGICTMVFTSPGPDNAVPMTLVNLAIVAAGAGEKTLLVDTLLGQPVLHRLLQCPLAPGLAEALRYPEEWQKGIQTTSVDNLSLLPVGTVTSASPTAFSSPAFDTLLRHCKTAYDLILFAVSPALGLSDAAILSSRVDATCLVLTSGVTRLDATEEARAALEAVQASVIGAILVSGKA